MECLSADDRRYEYASINENQIRIIYLQPGCYDDELRCELKALHENESIPYDALSYCWGKSSMDGELHCTGRLISISKQLSDALRRIRDKTEIKNLWVDQISINQENNVEKSAQVRRMGNTYSKARQTLIWLGEENKDTASVFNLFADVSQQIQECMSQPEIMDAFHKAAVVGLGYFPLRLSSADSSEWVAFREFNNQSWFTRTWTFQELVLSCQATLICGTYKIPWSQFLVVCEMIDAYDRVSLPGHESHLKESYRYIQYLTATNLFLTRQRSQLIAVPELKQTVELLNLVKALRQNDTSKPEDKLFALSGCAIDIDSKIGPFIDCTIPFEKSYIVFTKWFINRYHDLMALRLVNITDKPNSLPSWTPDFRIYDYWNNFRDLFGPKNILTHGADRMYNATGSSTASVTLNYESQLQLHGVHIGVISKISKAAGNLLGDIAIGPNVITGGLWHTTASEAFSNGAYPPTGEPVKLAYHRLRIGDHLWGEPRAQDRRARPKPLLSLPEPGPITYSDAIGLIKAERQDIGTLILKWTTRQKFFITDTGYMGLAHRSCNQGDHVYLLMGGDMPFVLRKNPSGTFRFKGESYVHGIMDGEYFLKNFKPSGDGDGAVSDNDWLASLNQNPLPFETETIILD